MSLSASSRQPSTLALMSSTVGYITSTADFAVGIVHDIYTIAVAGVNITA